MKRTSENGISSGEKFKIGRIPSLTFRRNYFYDETIYANKKLKEQLDNRNPEHSDPITRMKSSKYFKGFEKLNLLDSEFNLNLKQWNKIKNKNINQTHIFDKSYSVTISLNQESQYDLKICNKNKVLARTTVDFGFPPDVEFMVYDIDRDNQDEIVALHHWYIVNGDNYDFYICEIQ